MSARLVPTTATMKSVRTAGPSLSSIASELPRWSAPRLIRVGARVRVRVRVGVRVGVRVRFRVRVRVRVGVGVRVWVRVRIR